MGAFARALACLSLVVAAAGQAQVADTVLINGKVITADERGAIHQAVAIRDGRIVALGSSATLRKLAVRGARVIDLGGRTVIPGLIDSHMHSIRAALSFSTEVHWFGLGSID